jgi:DNA (cytosine-5)-methyltransferase 1
MRGDHPPSREAGEGVAPTITSRPSGGGGLGTDFDCDGGLIAGAVSAKWAKGTGGPAGDECYNLVAFDLQQATSPENRSQLSPDQTPTMGAAHQMAVAYKSTGNNGVYSTGDKIDTLSNCKDPNHDLIAFTCKDFGADATVEQSPTLRSMNEQDGNANSGGQIAVAGTAVRRLTPRECERLQAYPDDYTLIEFRGKPAADGPRYKALGNSMCVNEIRWVLQRIEQFEAIR